MDKEQEKIQELVQKDVDGVEKDSKKFEGKPPKVDTSNLDYIEQIAEGNEKVEIKEEVDLAEAEGREPAEWAKKPDDEEKDQEEFLDDGVKTDAKADEGEQEDPDGKKETVKIIVDGVEQEVELSKVLDAGTRTLQKETAADQRLEQATKLLNEAKERSGQLPSEKKDASAEHAASKVNLDELRADYIHASQYGTEEEMVEACKAWEQGIMGISSAPQQATVNDSPAVMKDEIKRTIAIVNLENRLNASPEDGGFSDIMTVPILRDQAGALVDSFVGNNKGSYDSFETYQKACEAVRSIATTLVPDYKLPEVVKKLDEKKDSFEEKREKKGTIVNLKTASSKAETKKKEDDGGEESISDVIAQIRKSRGQ